MNSFLHIFSTDFKNSKGAEFVPLLTPEYMLHASVEKMSQKM